MRSTQVAAIPSGDSLSSSGAIEHFTPKLLRELLPLILAQLLVRGFLLVYPALLVRALGATHPIGGSASVEFHQSVLTWMTQLDSLGVVFGGVFATAFLVLRLPQLLGHFFWYASFAGLVLSSVLPALLPSSVWLEWSKQAFFLFTYLGIMSGIWMGLATGILIQRQETIRAVRVLFTYYIAKILALGLASFGFLTKWLPVQSELILLTCFAAVISLLILVFTFGRSFLAISKEAIGEKSFHKTILSENAIGITRSLTPMGAFLILAHVPRSGASLTFCLSFAYVVGGICSVPLLASMPLALRTAQSFSLKMGRDFLIRYGALPTMILLGLSMPLLPSLSQRFLQHTLDRAESLYVCLFLVACMLGVVGHVWSLDLRVAGKSDNLARIFLVTETGVQIILLFGALKWLTLRSPPALSAALVSSIFGSIALIYAGSFTWMVRRAERKLRRMSSL